MTQCTVGFFLQCVCMFNVMMFYRCNSNGKYWKEKINYFLFKQRVGHYCIFKGSFKILLN